MDLLHHLLVTLHFAKEVVKEYEFTHFSARPTQSQGSVTQRGNWLYSCAKCGRTHIGVCNGSFNGFLKCGHNVHFMKEFPKNRQRNGNRGNKVQSSSTTPLDRDSPRGATSGTGDGENHLYVITRHQDQENSPDVVTGMIKVFSFDVYTLLIQGANLFFVTPYVGMVFDGLHEKILESFSV